MTNVKFIYFTNLFKTLIKAFSNLTFHNVIFEKIQPSRAESVIKIICTDNCVHNFFFEGGIIEDLNFGQEIKDNSNTGGFLDIANIHSVSIIGVIFRFNLAFSSSKFVKKTFFIKITNTYGKIFIKDCIFEGLYLNSLLYIDNNYLVYEDALKDVNGNSEAFNQQHFQISDCSFSNIYTSKYFLRYETEATTQNILIVGINFKDIISAENSLISLIFNGKLKKIDTIGETIAYNSITASISKRMIIIYGIGFGAINSAGYQIYVKGNPNIYIEQIWSYYFSDASKNSIEKIINFFSDHGKYIERVPTSEELGDIYCSGTIKIEGGYSLEMKTIYIEGTSCTHYSSPLGIIIEKISNSLKLQDLWFYYMNAYCLMAALLSF